MGPGAFRTTLTGLTAENDNFGFYLGVKNFTVPKNPNPQVTAQAQLYPSRSSGTSPITKTWGLTELSDTSEFGFGYWARALMTYPTRIWNLPDQYYLLSVFQVIPNSASVDAMGQRSLAIFIANNNRFLLQTQDTAAVAVIEGSVSFVGTQEG